jgi:hypothetical protein
MRKRVTKRLILLAFVAAIGFASRLFPMGSYLWDKAVGDAAWAAAIYLFLGLIFPIPRPVNLALVAIALAAAIELFKLTDLPSHWVRWAISRLIFGTTFSLENLGCYVVGICIIALIDHLL